MILQVALGLSVGVAEYTRIREAYRSLPRFSYTMKVTTESGTKTDEYAVNYIRGQGLRVRQFNRYRGWSRTVTHWQDQDRQFIWTEDKEYPVFRSGRMNGRNSYVVRLTTLPEPRPYRWQETRRPEGGLPVSFVNHPGIDWWAVQTHPARFEIPPEVRIDGKPYRRLVLYDKHGLRTTLLYERDRRLLREIKDEAMENGVYLVLRKATFQHQDAQKLSPPDVSHPGTMRIFPPLAVKPLGVPPPDRPVPNRVKTLEDFEAALRKRYRGLDTLRLTIAPAPGTFATSPFRMTMAMDRQAEGDCMVRRGRFETIAWVRKGMMDAGHVWHVSAFQGRVLAKMQENFFPSNATPVGLSIMRTAWHDLDLELARQGWKFRTDRWRGRPMQVLHRISYRNLRPGSHVSQPGDYVAAGQEEVWIDASSGLIVRSRRFCSLEQEKEGFDVYDVAHTSEPNVRLTPRDLEFKPTPVDLVRLLDRELQEGGGRVSEDY